MAAHTDGPDDGLLADGLIDFTLHTDPDGVHLGVDNSEVHLSLTMTPDQADDLAKHLAEAATELRSFRDNQPEPSKVVPFRGRGRRS